MDFNSFPAVVFYRKILLVITLHPAKFFYGKMGIEYFCLLLILCNDLVRDNITEMVIYLSSLILQLGLYKQWIAIYKGLFSVFPASAGVILAHSISTHAVQSVSRKRGGDPSIVKFLYRSLRHLPQARGWFWLPGHSKALLECFLQERGNLAVQMGDDRLNLKLLK